MFTPSGRFRTHYRLCLSISDYHPESWSPIWGVETIMIGLISFMCENNKHAVGSLNESSDARKTKAAESLRENLNGN